MTAAVFLDRDGVINRKAPEGQYVTTWEGLEVLPGVAGALRTLREHGARLIVVTNQRGVARGVMTTADVDELHRRLLADLSTAGAPLDAILVCPHETGTCDCRKPGVGLFLQARDRFPDISFEESVVVGDSLTDLEPGARLGCRTFLVASPERRREIELQAAERGFRIDGAAESLEALVAAGGLFGDVPEEATA